MKCRNFPSKTVNAFRRMNNIQKPCTLAEKQHDTMGHTPYLQCLTWDEVFTIILLDELNVILP